MSPSRPERGCLCAVCKRRELEIARDQSWAGLWACYFKYAAGATDLFNLDLAVHRAERHGYSRAEIAEQVATRELPTEPLRRISTWGELAFDA